MGVHYVKAETYGKFQSEFFADENLRTKKHDREVQHIYTTWHHSPGGGIPNDFWSARWTGKVKPPVDGKYTFKIFHDSGLRLWLDDELVVDRNWIKKKDWN